MMSAAGVLQWRTKGEQRFFKEKIYRLIKNIFTKIIFIHIQYRFFWFVVIDSVYINKPIPPQSMHLP